MSKLNCSIVKDLLPSYVDGICSEDSGRLVEEHLASCQECRASERMMRESEGVRQQGEMKQIAYLRKLKRHVRTRELLSLLLLVCVAGAGAGMLIKGYGGISLNYYYVLLPVLLADTYFLVSDRTSRSERTGRKTALTVLGGVLTAYCALLELLGAQCMRTGSYPFGLAQDKLGLFFGRQCLLLVFCQTAVFIAALVLTLKTSNPHSAAIGISLTGAFLALAFFSLLHTLSDAESAAAAMRNSALILLAEGIVITGAALLLEKARGCNLKSDLL